MMRMLLNTLLFVYTTNANQIQISTTLGDIDGIEESGYGVFRGIPYTEDIMDGNNRFKPSSVRISPFSTNPFDATNYGPNCIQIPERAPQSEDCLFLNIWTPKVNNARLHYSLPVLLFIHGGSFRSGAGSSALVTGGTFLRNKNIVYVTINYRLSGLGFLALHDLLIETNMATTGGSNGILDAINAIKFVKNYISDFGGNPEQITIFGSSAGARAVNAIILSPLAKDLINNAIIQSGSLAQKGIGFKSMDEALTFTEDVLNSENIQNNITLLRSLDAATVTALGWRTPLDNGLIVKGEIGIPSADGFVLEDTPLNMLNEPDLEIYANNVIIGFNEIDSLMAFPFYYFRDSDDIPLVPTTESEFNIYMNEYIQDTTLLNDVLQYYDINNYPAFDKFTNYGMFYSKMNAESCYICTSINLAKKLVKNTNEQDINVYVYQLIGPQYPSVHVNELAYVYNNSLINTIIYGDKIPFDQGLANLMHNYWLDMTINNRLDEEWLPFDLTNEYIMNFRDGDTSSISAGYGNNRCDYWINDIGLDIIGSICIQDKVVTIPPTNPSTCCACLEKSLDPKGDANCQSDVSCHEIVCVIGSGDFDPDPYCCDAAWDPKCVHKAGKVCELNITPSPITPSPVSDEFVCCNCLEESSAGGTEECMNDLNCIQHICWAGHPVGLNDDYFCCTNAWDYICTDNAKKICELEQTPSPVEPPTFAANSICCDCLVEKNTPKGTTECQNDIGCQDIMCDIDRFCCETAWDSICVSKARPICLS